MHGSQLASHGYANVHDTQVFPKLLSMSEMQVLLAGNMHHCTPHNSSRKAILVAHHVAHFGCRIHAAQSLWLRWTTKF
eukprot:365048-Chlamydomonas_euryale.AAC.28